MMKLLVFFVGMSALIYVKASSIPVASSSTGIEAKNAVDCPTITPVVLNPSKGLGTLNCIGSKEMCKKMEQIDCVGHLKPLELQREGKCYRWKCNEIPNGLDYNIAVKGENWDIIEITIFPPDPFMGLLALLMMVAMFITAPGFMCGLLLGSSGGSGTHSREWDQ